MLAIDDLLGMRISMFRLILKHKSRLVGLLALATIAVGSMAPSTIIHAADCRTQDDTKDCKYGLPLDQYNALLPMMQANAAPFGQALSLDSTDMKAYTEYAANGAVLKSPSALTGVLLSGNAPYPMAWVVENVKPSAHPGGDPDPSAPILPRYTRVYRFATVIANDYQWYLIAPGQWIERRAVALVKLPTRPEGVKGHWVAVDIAEELLYAYEDDKLVFMTLISSGMAEHPTHLGIFQIRTHYATADMTGAMGTPDYYWLPNVPYVMYFDGDIGLHGAYWHDGFGYVRSHGCVNMSITDAKWLFDWSNNVDTTVYIWSTRA
jgi:hypothetical protein